MQLLSPLKSTFLFTLIVKTTRVTTCTRAGENNMKTHKIFCDYKIPLYEELKKEFGYVSSIFDGRPFTLHESCKDVSSKPRELEITIKHFDRFIESEEAIKEIEKDGYRPATHLEAYAFQKLNPKLQEEYPIVALGSFAVCGGSWYVAVLDGDPSGRILDNLWFDGRWSASYRFLFVREKSSSPKTLEPSILLYEPSVASSLVKIEQHLEKIAKVLTKKK